MPIFKKDGEYFNKDILIMKVDLYSNLSDFYFVNNINALVISD